jgi:hypothetical protein
MGTKKTKKKKKKEAERGRLCHRHGRHRGFFWLPGPQPIDLDRQKLFGNV